MRTKFFTLLLIVLGASNYSSACHNASTSVSATSDGTTATITVSVCVSMEDGFGATSSIGATIGGCGAGDVVWSTSSISYSYDVIGGFPTCASWTAAGSPTTTVSGTATCVDDGNGNITCTPDDPAIPIGPDAIDVSCCPGSTGQCNGGNPPISYPDLGNGLTLCFDLVATAPVACAADVTSVIMEGASDCGEVIVLNIVLPITISSFTAQANKDHNVIRWTTASEINNQYQIIETSPNGIDNWTEVSRVNGHALSLEENSYEVMDYNPMNESFYRVRSIDYNGASEVSKVISITRENGNRGNFNVITLTPNPTSNNSFIYLENQDNKFSTNVNIYDVHGKLINATSISNENSTSFELQTADLVKGVYYVHVQNGNDVVVKKLLKI